MSLSRLRLIFSIVITLIITIFCIRLISCNNSPGKGVIIDNTAELRKDLDRQNANYSAKIDSINQVNRSLRSQAVSSQSAILKIKQENRSLKRTIKDLLTVHYTATDTAIKLQNCDSLAVMLQETEAFSLRKDSIYESLTNNLQRQLEIQDSVIDIQKFQNDSLQTSYQSLLDQHTALITENAEQRKAIKKQKKGKAFLGVVAGVVAGLFTWHSLK
jgi:hypothetical protein